MFNQTGSTYVGTLQRQHLAPQRISRCAFCGDRDLHVARNGLCSCCTAEIRAAERGQWQLLAKLVFAIGAARAGT